MAPSTGLGLIVALLAASSASAQDGRYVQGESRGLLYGTHFVSPIHVTSFERPGGSERLLPGGAFGLRARVGYELGLGLSIEAYGGIAVHGVDTEMRAVRDRMITADLGVAARYWIFVDSAFVPFVQVGVGLRYFDIEWPSTEGEDDTFALPLHGAVGAHLQLAPWVGLEVGVLVDYTFGLAILEDGVLAVAPFAGVTLFAYDENDPI